MGYRIINMYEAYIYIYKYHNIMILKDKWVESSSWGFYILTGKNLKPLFPCRK